MPPHVATLATQINRRRRALEALPDDFHRYAFLRELQDTNEVLFQALVQNDLPRMLPLVYTPTVGEGCRRFSEIWRRPRGLFLSWPNRDRIADIIADPALDRVKVIVVSDGERILVLGDQGAGGMGIPIGKLALYTACAGIDPGEVLPILLDVGTDNRTLHNDPLYVGWRHERVRGQDYDDFVEQFVAAVSARWPHVLLQWEDFAGANAYRLLDRYRHRLLSFNDDIQGTAATALGALLSAVHRAGGRLSDQRIVFVGAGAAGTGIAALIRRAMIADGMDEQTAADAFWAVDRNGLVTSDQQGLPAAQQPLARDPAETEDWTRASDGTIALAEVVRRVKPTAMIGTTGHAGTFTEEAVRAMADGTDAPIVFPLSNPVTHSEADPASIRHWTGGRAIVGTGSPFDVPGAAQVNNVHVFPGIGLGVTLCGATRVSDAMFLAAARALAAEAAKADVLLPPMTALRSTARAVALAVIACARDEGLATREVSDINASMWKPCYGDIVER